MADGVRGVSGEANGDASGRFHQVSARVGTAGSGGGGAADGPQSAQFVSLMDAEHTAPLCRRCGAKLIRGFVKDGGSWPPSRQKVDDRLCNFCEKKRQADWKARNLEWVRRRGREKAMVRRKKDPERWKASARARTKRIHLRALGLVSRGRLMCCRCGCDDVSILQINHINGGGSRECRTGTPSFYGRILSGRRTISDLNILCAVCNWLDHVERTHPEIRGRYRLEWASSEKVG